MTESDKMNSKDHMQDEMLSQEEDDLKMLIFPIQGFISRLEDLLDAGEQWVSDRKDYNENSKNQSDHSRSHSTVQEDKNHMFKREYGNKGFSVDKAIDYISKQATKWDREYSKIKKGNLHKLDTMVKEKTSLSKIDRKESILMKALEYLVNLSEYSAIQELLNFANFNKLIVKITSNTVVVLLSRFPDSEAIDLMKLLVDKDAQLINIGSDSTTSKDEDKRGEKGYKKESKNEEEKRSISQVLEDEEDDEDTKLDKDSIRGDTNNYFSSEVIQESVYLQQEYFGLHHALEITFRSKIFDDEKELEIYKCLFNGLECSEIQGIFVVNLMIAYNRQVLYIRICRHLLNPKARQKDITEFSTFIKSDSMNTPVSVKENKYSSEEMILDGIKYSLKHENIKFLNNLLENFTQEAALHPFPVASYIVKSLSKRLREKKLIPYIDDKFRILESLCALNTAQTTTIVQLIKLIHDMLDVEPRLNVFTNVYNPLRLYIMIIRMLDTFSQVVDNMDGIFSKLYERLEQYVVNMIDE